MRFLFFNLVVALALIYLFGGQRPEIQAAGEKAGQALDQIKSMATSALGQGHAAPPAPTKPEPKTPAAVKPKPDRKAEQLPAPRPQVMPTMVPLAPRPQVEIQPLAEAAAPAPAEAKPTPDVAKRRAEVLATQPVEIAEDGKLMTAAERRRALYRLAEEMELFSAGASIQ